MHYLAFSLAKYMLSVPSLSHQIDQHNTIVKTSETGGCAWHQPHLRRAGGQSQHGSRRGAGITHAVQHGASPQQRGSASFDFVEFRRDSAECKQACFCSRCSVISISYLPQRGNNSIIYLYIIIIIYKLNIRYLVRIAFSK